jgi:serine/threonine protein kinase
VEETESTLIPGYALDRYELLCPLATGGMATVWLARMRGKRGFEKLFAIKTIRAELSDDAHFEEMFLDEAHIAALIQHPNVANILDLGDKDGILYLVMEWVDGESLAKVRKFAAKAGAKIPLGLALRIISDACAGLHAAHELKDESGRELGVVHRDVSPQNVLIATSGAVKVIDFGIAKAENRAAPKTRTGIVKGKLQYMAPEQARATKGPIDRRVDLWALGVCLYELISDALPFDGENQFEILAKVTGTEPFAPIEGLPASVQEILEHSLARSPDERFSSAAAMRRAIESAITELGLPSTSDDVGAFVAKYLPERAAKRKELVAKALKDAAQRAQDSEPQVGTAEVALDSRGRPVSDGSIRSPRDPKATSGPGSLGGVAGRTPAGGMGPPSGATPPGRPLRSARDILDRPSADPAAMGTLISAELAASAGIPRAGGVKRLLAVLVVAGAAAGGYYYYVRPASRASAVTELPAPVTVNPSDVASSSAVPPPPPVPTLVVTPPEAPRPAASGAAAASGEPGSGSPSASAAVSALVDASVAPVPLLHAPFIPHMPRRPGTAPAPVLPAFSALPEPEIPTIAPPNTAGSTSRPRDPTTGEAN